MSISIFPSRPLCPSVQSLLGFILLIGLRERPALRFFLFDTASLEEDSLKAELQQGFQLFLSSHRRRTSAADRRQIGKILNAVRQSEISLSDI